MKKKMSEVDVRVSNNIYKMYMSDAQYERVAEAEAEEKKGRDLTENEYFELKCKLY